MECRLGLEAIALRLAIASRLEAITLRLEAIAFRMGPLLLGWRSLLCFGMLLVRSL